MEFIVWAEAVGCVQEVVWEKSIIACAHTQTVEAPTLLYCTVFDLFVLHKLYHK